MEIELNSLFNIDNVHFYAFTFTHTITAIVIFLLLVVSALISGSEVAFFSLTPAHIQKLEASENNKRSALIIKVLKFPEKLLATILVANNFVNIAIVITTSYFTSSLINFADAKVLEFTFKVVVITFLILFFGEIIPKIYATHLALKFATLMVYPINILQVVLNPFNRVLIKISALLNKRFLTKKRTASIEEISKALKITSQETDEEKSILEAIVRFNGIDVGEIKNPRVNITAIDANTSFTEVMQVIKKSQYSRIPVYTESFDNIKGVLYSKDLLPHISKGNRFRWQSLIRPPYYVPETKKINTLLDEFKTRKIHLAIVVDEYGGTSGIVTMEDILEEIVGDVYDERNDRGGIYKKINKNTYIFEGITPLNDFYKILSIPEDVFEKERGEADTIAGLLIENKGEIPKVNEKLTIGDIIFTIKSADKRKIKKLKVQITGSLQKKKL